MSQGEKSFWHELLDRKVSRRQAIGTAVAASAAASLPVTITNAEAAANNGAPAANVGEASRRLPPFRPSERSTADTMTLPQGYRFQVLAPWGRSSTSAATRWALTTTTWATFPSTCSAAAPRAPTPCSRSTRST